MAVRVRIGRLDVHGLAPGEAQALAEALQAALRDGIARGGPPRALPARASCGASWPARVPRWAWQCWSW